MQAPIKLHCSNVPAAFAEIVHVDHVSKFEICMSKVHYRVIGIASDIGSKDAAGYESTKVTGLGRRTSLTRPHNYIEGEFRVHGKISQHLAPCTQARSYSDSAYTRARGDI